MSHPYSERCYCRACYFERVWRDSPGLPTVVAMLVGITIGMFVLPPLAVLLWRLFT